MATIVERHEPTALDQLLATRRGVAWGLLWAALMLVLLACWVYVKDLDGGILYYGPLAVLAVAAAGLGIKQLLRPTAEGASEPQQVEAVLRQRRQVAVAAYVGAAALLVIAAALAFQFGLSAFGEVSTLAALAVVGGVTGFALSSSPGTGLTQVRFLDALLRGRQQVLVGLVVLAVAAAGFVIWRGVSNKGVTPDVIAAFLLFITYASLAVWQALTPPETVTRQNMRLLVLLAGGLTGFIIAVFTVVIVWRAWNDIFPPQTPMSQSEGVWMLWLGIYVELLALALLFASLLLARADIRESVVMRRLLYGYNAALTGLLVLAILAVANVVVYVTLPETFDWSKEGGLQALAPTSRSLLESLNRPARVYVVMTERSPVYREVRTLLNNSQSVSRLLQVEYVSPDRDSAEYRRLLQTFPIIESAGESINPHMRQERGGLLIVNEPDARGKGKHAWIPAGNLEEFSMQGREERRLFKGEDQLMTQLRILVGDETKPKVYFTQGNGELDLENNSDRLTIEDQFMGDLRGGAGLLADRLRKDNYEVKGLVWGPAPRKGPPGDLFVFTKTDPDAREHEIKPDVKLLIIAHPLKPFEPDQIKALEDFMDRGGKLIVLSSYAIKRRGGQVLTTGLEDFLKKYNVDLAKEFSYRLPEGRREPLITLARTPANSPIKVAADFLGEEFPLGGEDQGPIIALARVVRPLKHPGPFQAHPLLTARPPNEYWAETVEALSKHPIDYRMYLERTGKLQEKRSGEPVTLGVGVMDRDKKARLVVLGDARFGSNLFVRDKVPYYDFLTSTIAWLQDRPRDSGIGPRISGVYQVRLDDTQRQRVSWLPLGLILLGLGGLGAGIWLVRRR